MKRRRSLTHVGGKAERWGRPDLSAALAEALDVAPAEEPRGDSGGQGRDEPDRTHVHGFHAYPARMHPTTASRLVRAVSAAGETVLDPFCGSGTVLVEAMLAGRVAIGTDLNPLAIRLATLKTTPLDLAARTAMLEAARRAAALADERRQRRAGASRRYPPEDVAAFDPHVLLELDSLRTGVLGLPEQDPSRAALELALSAILVKITRRSSDTGAQATPRRIAAGYPSRLFVKKVEELGRRLADFEALLPPAPAGGVRARVALDDIARMQTVPAGSVDAVVTSPPYVATYDYLAHHALRMRWLGLDAQAFSAGEVGSRRRYATLGGREGLEAWSRELTTILRALARACRKGGRAVLVVADSAVRGEALRADLLLTSLAPESGFELLARASQIRPHFHGPTARAFESAPRAEHAIVLEKR